MSDFLIDYVSNPKSEKWNSPDYPYNIYYAIVRNKVSANQKNVTKSMMQCRSIEQAQSIIEHWSENDDNHTYIITARVRRT